MTKKDNIKVKPLGKPIDNDEKKELIKGYKENFTEIAAAFLEDRNRRHGKRYMIDAASDAISWVAADGLDNIFVHEHLLKTYGLSRGDIIFYRRKYPEFDQLMTAALELQELKLARMMLRNKVNTQGAVFVLKNRHGWTEKTQVEVTQDVVDAVHQARQRLVAVRTDYQLEESQENNLAIDVEYTVEQDNVKLAEYTSTDEKS